MKCSICEKEISVKDGGWSQGNNAQPVNDGRCCDDCNMSVVVPARLAELSGRQDEGDEEHMLYLLHYNGYTSVVSEGENWSVAYEMTGETGRLFAAAPALLAALKELVKRAESQLWSDHWLADARKVIAKAEGGE